MPRAVSSRFKNFILILLSAVCLVLPFHFGEFGVLAFVAFIPYFFAIDGKSPRLAFQSSYLFGFLTFILLGYWLAFVNVLGLLLTVAYLALYFGFFGWLSSYFLSAQRRLRELFYISAFWVLTEVLRGWLIGGLPWALLGYSQWKNPIFIQIADVTGAYGVSFFIMLVNLILFKMLKCAKTLQAEEGRDRLLKSLGLLLLTAFLAVGGYGVFQLRRVDAFYKNPNPKARLRVSIIQGNIPQDQKWDTRIKNIIFEKYRRLTLMAASERPDLIVWPETSFPGYLEDETLLASRLRSLVRQTRTEVLVGAPTLGDLEQEGLRFYNSAILYGADGEEKKRYDKLHLVPFGEYIPFEPVLGFIRNFSPIGRFSSGKEQTVFETSTRAQKNNVRVRYSALICYEDIFPGLVRAARRNGADFLVNMSNDAWFGKTSAPYQHAQASIFRAVENRVWVIRATNTGFSCFISPEGRLADWVEDNGKEIFVTGRKSFDLVLRKTESFYTRFGDVFVWLNLLLVAAAWRQKSRENVYFN